MEEHDKIGSISGCHKLSKEDILDLNASSVRLPIRGVIGVIRNITDFGVFVDFGYSNDGLIHTSMLGAKKLESFLIGEQLGIDILSVVNGGNKIALSLNGLDSEPSFQNGTRSRTSRTRKVDTSNCGKTKGRKRGVVTEKLSSKKRRKL